MFVTVCLLGLDVPFILRKIDVNTYIVIEETYIHDVMNGKIMSVRDASYTQQVQNIKLQ